MQFSQVLGMLDIAWCHSVVACAELPISRVRHSANVEWLVQCVGPPYPLRLNTSYGIDMYECIYVCMC